MMQAKKRIGRPRQNLTGEKFGKLYVIGVDEEESERAAKLLWECVCDCGNRTTAESHQLTSGKKKSCGCLKREAAIPPAIVKHGMSDTRLYQCWKDMKGRCLRPSSSRFHTHGGRGISLCPEWHNFEPFCEWALAHGYRDDLTIDRIDNDGGYCPENCRWTTLVVQGNNRRTNVFVEYNGERLTVADLSRRTGVKLNTLRSRLRKGASVEAAINKNNYKKGELKNG